MWNKLLQLLTSGLLSTCVDRMQVCERGYETGFVVMGTHLSLTSQQYTKQNE